MQYQLVRDNRPIKTRGQTNNPGPDYYNKKACCLKKDQKRSCSSCRSVAQYSFSDDECCSKVSSVLLVPVLRPQFKSDINSRQTNAVDFREIDVCKPLTWPTEYNSRRRILSDTYAMTGRIPPRKNPRNPYVAAPLNAINSRYRARI